MSKIQVNEIVNHFDNGAPDCPQGLTIAGVATAATLDVTGNVSVGGTLSYDDVTNIDSVGIITAQAGVDVTGGTVTVGTAITLRQNGNGQFSGVVLSGIDPRGGGGTGVYVDGPSGAIVAGATGSNAILRGFQSGGSENFRFSADGSGFAMGNLGIGTDNPSSSLQVTNQNGGGFIDLGIPVKDDQYQYINFGATSTGQAGWQIGRTISGTAGIAGTSNGFYIYNITSAM